VKPPKTHLDKHPIKSLADLKGGTGASRTYEKPSPRMARLKPGRVLSAEEKAAFLASRPDLKK
jgi:hypothetical protein